MKRIGCMLLLMALLFLVALPNTSYAVGDGNLDGGGGGMGQGTSQNKWTPGMEGVRVTVIRSEDRTLSLIHICW